MKSLFTVVVAFFGLAACHPQLNPGRCNSTTDCPTGQMCDLTQNGVCVCSSPGCADGGGTGGSATGGTGGGAASGGVAGTTDGGGKDSSDASHGCQSRSDCLSTYTGLQFHGRLRPVQRQHRHYGLPGFD